MDKELTEIAPTNLDGSEIEPVNTVKKASAEEVKAAAEAEKAKKQDFYVDPLEQEAKMKEKLEKIEELKALERKENGEPEETDYYEPEKVRPDMNVSGYFSTGATAKKEGVMKRPASAGALTFCMIFGIIGAIYSAFYTVTLISTTFSVNWFMGWIYAVVAVTSLIVLLTGVRSLKVQNESLKRNALIGIVGAAISVIPLVAWLVHWVAQLF